jgi:hypothetical protein
MGKKLHNKGAAKTKPMSSKLLWRFSPLNYGLGSVQPWEVWLDYEDARRAWKKMSPGPAREMAKCKATAARIFGLWEIERIEENGRLEEEAERKRVLALVTAASCTSNGGAARTEKREVDLEDFE